MAIHGMIRMRFSLFYSEKKIKPPVEKNFSRRLVLQKGDDNSCYRPFCVYYIV